MTRDQKRRAIEGPVAVGNAKITPRLTQQLLNDLGDNPDQLPILQHALMRTWSYWARFKDWRRRAAGPQALRSDWYDVRGIVHARQRGLR